MEERVEEGDQWGLLPGVEPGDLSILADYQEFARTPRGERILEHLKMILHAGETLTIEEQMTQSGQYTPIDPTALLIRTGMRRAWALIETHVHGLERLENARGGRPR